MDALTAEFERVGLIDAVTDDATAQQDGESTSSASDSDQTGPDDEGTDVDGGAGADGDEIPDETPDDLVENYVGFDADVPVTSAGR